MFNFLLNFAQSCQPNQAYPDPWGIPTWYKYLPSNPDAVTGNCMPLNGVDFDFFNINILLGIGLAIGEILLRIVAIVAVGFIIYGGFQYLVSQGEPDRTAAAKNTILNALVGMVIAILANTIVVFVGTRLTENSRTSNLGLPAVPFTPETIPGIINIVMAVMGGISIIIITISGFKYTMSMGEPAATKKAKDTILYAFIGLIVAILAVTLVSLVTRQLT